MAAPAAQQQTERSGVLHVLGSYQGPREAGNGELILAVYTNSAALERSRTRCGPGSCLPAGSLLRLWCCACRASAVLHVLGSHAAHTVRAGRVTITGNVLPKLRTQSVYGRTRHHAPGAASLPGDACWLRCPSCARLWGKLHPTQCACGLTQGVHVRAQAQERPVCRDRPHGCTSRCSASGQAGHAWVAGIRCSACAKVAGIRCAFWCAAGTTECLGGGLAVQELCPCICTNEQAGCACSLTGRQGAVPGNGRAGASRQPAALQFVGQACVQVHAIVVGVLIAPEAVHA